MLKMPFIAIVMSRTHPRVRHSRAMPHRRSGAAATFGRSGYVFLLSVLFVGAIAITTVAALVLLGIASERSGFSFSKSTQARWNARTCVERALRSLRDSNSYAGSETFTLVDGTCTLRAIGGSGNANRRICVEGRAGDAVRRIEVDVEELLPVGEIRTWREVAAFSLCP